MQYAFLSNMNLLRVTIDGAAHAYCKNGNNVSHMTIILLLLRLSASATFTYAYPWQRHQRLLYAWQTATPYNDPNNLCSAGATGYRATRGCTGYVFCNNGYLMGGGAAGETVNSVIYCGSNQLFDEGVGACTAKQNVKCPGGDTFNGNNPSKLSMTGRLTRRPNRNRNPIVGNIPVAPSTARPPSTSNTQPYSEPEHGNPLAPWMASPPTNPVTPSTARPPPSNTQPYSTRRPTRQPSRWPTVEVIANKPAAAILIDSFSSRRPMTPLPTPYPSKPPTTENNRPDIIWLPAEEDYNNRPTYLSFEGDPAKRFCAHDWAHVIQNCLTAIPCPGGYAQGVCPNGMNCIADAPCSDQAYLNFLRGEQQASNNGGSFEGEVIVVSSKPSPSKTTSTNSNNGIGGRCSSDRYCSFGQFCNQPDSEMDGYCGDCLPNGRGCSTEQVCRTSGYKKMVCESQTQTTQQAAETVDDGAMYPNPDGNNFFCGVTHAKITGKCLQSKPCPAGVASIDCSGNEGCFFVPSCTKEYSQKTTTMQQSKPLTAQPTKMPSRIPTRQPVMPNRTARPTPKPVTPNPNPTKQPTPRPINPTEKPTSIIMFNPPTSSYELVQTESKNPTRPTPRPTQQPEIADNLPPTQPILAALFPEETNVESNESSTAVGRVEANQNQLKTSETSSQTQSAATETCSLCGASKLDWSQRVNLGDNEISCGEFGWIFSSESIQEGSDRCLNFRGQYFDECCNTKQANDYYGSQTISHNSLGSGGASSSPTMSSTHKPTRESNKANEGNHAIISHNSLGLGGASPSPIMPSKPKPNREFSKWKSVSLLAPASTIMVSSWSCCLSVAVGLLVI